jgi:hypothetical protein
MTEKKSKVVRIEVDCVYNASHNRAFVTRCLNDAINMLLNKLDRRGVVAQKGKLVFEFVPSRKRRRWKCQNLS